MTLMRAPLGIGCDEFESHARPGHVIWHTRCSSEPTSPERDMLGTLVRLTLLRSVVAVEKQIPTVLVTIPAGASVECDPAGRNVGLVDVMWERQHYSVNLQDLLDACAVGDILRITWP